MKKMLQERLLRTVYKRHKSNLSYFHHPGSQPLKHIPLGVTISEAAEKWPDRPAIISLFENKTLTFSELLVESDKLAASLMASGMERGDRLGIWLPNCTQWIVAMLAASRCGLISVAINHLYGPKELKYALKKVGVKTLVAPGSRFSPKYYNIIQECVPELNKSDPGNIKCNLDDLKSIVLAKNDKDLPGTLAYESLINRGSTFEINKTSTEAHSINPDCGCNIQYTSGTTGNPKAAILSHHGIVNNGFVIGARNNLDTVPKKVCVQVPLFHVFGVVVTISACLQHGATIVLPSPTYSPKSNLKALVTEKCGVIHGTPTMHVDLVNEVKSASVPDLKCQIAVTGGSPVTPQLVEDMARVLGVSKVKSVFGMTETTAVNFQSLPEEDFQKSLHYLGQLHDHLEAKVVNENNDIIPFGEKGELWIRGYSQMIGYWDDELKTKEIFDPSGWIKTGDQVILHEDGYSQIMGRLKDIIIRGGENIAPKEIEDAMSSHPDVLECQVFGVSDDRLGEEICAAVRLREGAILDTLKLKNHLQSNLAKYKIPKIIKQVEGFPKTASGKIQKFKLKDMVESGII